MPSTVYQPDPPFVTDLRPFYVVWHIGAFGRGGFHAVNDRRTGRVVRSWENVTDPWDWTHHAATAHAAELNLEFVERTLHEEREAAVRRVSENYERAMLLLGSDHGRVGSSSVGGAR
jgi:hypothetical protein